MKKISDILIITACIVIVGAFFINGITGFGGSVVEADAAEITETLVATPTPYINRIEATYSGPSVIVGEKFDMSKLTVTATYDNGAQEDIKDFSVSDEIIHNTGMNTVIVMYKDLSTKAFIYGRQLMSISVSPNRLDYGIGNMPDCEDLRVIGVYSDGSVEDIKDHFDIYPDRIDKVGRNEVTVVYQGKDAKCTVYGNNWDKVVALGVTYKKQNAITNVKISKDDLTVMAVYSDLSTERITTYTIENEIFIDSGKQKLTVSYGGVRKSIEINVIERYITGISAEYTGGAVTVGRDFRRADMHVYLEYVDGAVEETDDYSVHTRKIRYIGNNLITVYYGDKLFTSVIIEGSELKVPDFDYVSTQTLSNSDMEIKIRTAIPQYLAEDCMDVTLVKNSAVRKAYKKLKLKSGNYIAFNYDFADPDDELELPLTIRITIPEDYDIEHTFLYYTPNKKTILGRMNKRVITDRVFECTLFKTGTYILVYSEQLTDKPEEEE